MLQLVIFCVAGTGFGLLAAAGVFTVFVAVGLVPRFAGRTNTAGAILLYEDMVVLGTILGSYASVFSEVCRFWQVGKILPIFFGLFGGIFVGCLALTIAEMLDSIPIFSRRISFKRGLWLAVWGMALGKFAGSLLYFGKGFGR